MINQASAYNDDNQNESESAERKRNEAFKYMARSLINDSDNNKRSAAIHDDLEKINEIIKKEREQRIDQGRIAAINKATEEARTKHDQEHGTDDQKQHEALKQMAHTLFSEGKDGEE